MIQDAEAACGVDLLAALNRLDVLKVCAPENSNMSQVGS